MTLVPERGEPVTLEYLDVDDLFDDDYTMRLTDFAGRRYDLSMLGKAYGQILHDVRLHRNDVLQHELLLTGINLQGQFPGKWFPGGGVEPIPVEVRVFEDLMVVVPERGVMWGLPYSFVEEVRFDEELYQVHVVADDGRDHVFGMMGKRSAEFVKELRRTLDALAARTARTLGELVPGLEPAVLSALASRMRDGRAVQQREVDAVAPGAWARLVDAVMGTPDLRSTYDRLTSMCPPGWAALGVKAVLTEEESAADADAGSGSGSGSAWHPPDAATSRTGHLQHTQDSAAANRAESSGRQAGMPLGMGAIVSQMGDQMSGAASAAAGEAARAAVAEAMAQMAGQQQPTATGDASAGEGSGEQDAAESEEDRAKTIQWFFTPLADAVRPL